MIERVSLKNFQSHADTEVEFSTGVNVIVGESDKGKSAILRSLYWVLTNRPSGDSIWSDWARGIEPCEVTVTTTDHTVTRRREKKTNSYTLDGEELSAVGVEVPEAVGRALNFSEVNIQRQMDAPFLLSASAGEVSRFFNSVLSMEDIDASMTVMTARRRENIAGLRTTAEQIKHIEEQIKELDWVDEAQTKFKGLQDIEGRIQSSRQKVSLARQTIADIHRVQGKISEADKLTSLSTEVDRLLDLQTNITTLSAKVRRCKGLTADISAAQKTIEGARDYASLDVEGLIGIAGEIEKKQRRLDALRRMLSQIAAQIATIKTAGKEVETLIATLPSVCPSCGQEIK